MSLAECLAALKDSSTLRMCARFCRKWSWSLITGCGSTAKCTADSSCIRETFSAKRTKMRSVLPRMLQLLNLLFGLDFALYYFKFCHQADHGDQMWQVGTVQLTQAQ